MNVTVIDPPVVVPPADINIDANALFTKVDLGTATATDYLGNPLPVSQVDDVTFFWPGANTAIWQATDQFGLTSYASQAVNVKPLVSFSKDQTTAEGAVVTLKVVLNGPSPVYPLNVSYQVSGTATNPADHDLASGVAVIASGTETTITINTVPADGIEGDETIILTMDNPALNQGVHNQHIVTLSEDNLEAFSDADRDGIPDYLDSINECNVLPEQGLLFNPDSDRGYLVEGDPGVCVRIGNHALIGETGGSQVTDTDIAVDDLDLLVPDPEVTNIGGLFDFIITELPDEGQSVNIVIPQQLAIPANGIYRKFNDSMGWYTFIEDSNNLLWSTAGEAGFCPPPGSADFTPGLTEGHWCVQLTIEDGGPNDADGIVNRMVVDPGGVGILGSVSFTTRGGGAMATWWLMLLITFGLVRLRRREVVLALMFILVPVQSQAQSDAITILEQVNITPIAQDDVVSTDEDTEVSIPVLNNYLDSDGDSLSIVATSVDVGEVSVTPQGQILYIPPVKYNGKALIQYSIYDGEGSIPLSLAAGIGIQSSDPRIACSQSEDICKSMDTRPIEARLQINFAMDDATVGSENYAEIEKLAKVMRRASGEKVTIEGHTSSTGSSGYNQKLSERRARAVAKVLVDEFNIDSERVASIGYGESRLIDERNIDEAHTINRRIEAVFDVVIFERIELRSGVASAEVEVTINNIEYPPVAVDDQAEVDQYQSVVIPVLTNDSDEDGDALKVVSASSTNATVVIQANNWLKYTPNVEFYGLDDLLYSIEDTSGNSDQASVKVTVNYVLRLSPWYVWGGLGFAEGSSSKSSLEQEFADLGLNITINKLDNSRIMGQGGVGYHFTEGLSVELGYLDLGEVTINMTGPDTNHNLLSQVHPLSAKGLVLAAQYHWQLSRLGILLRGGMFNWEGDFITRSVAPIGSNSIDGSDIFFGVGATLGFTHQLQGRLILHRFKVDSEDITALSVGLVYRFED